MLWLIRGRCMQIPLWRMREPIAYSDDCHANNWSAIRWQTSQSICRTFECQLRWITRTDLVPTPNIGWHPNSPPPPQKIHNRRMEILAGKPIQSRPWKFQNAMPECKKASRITQFKIKFNLHSKSTSNDVISSHGSGTESNMNFVERRYSSRSLWKDGHRNDNLMSPVWFSLRHDNIQMVWYANRWNRSIDYWTSPFISHWLMIRLRHGRLQKLVKCDAYSAKKGKSEKLVMVYACAQTL